MNIWHNNKIRTRTRIALRTSTTVAGGLRGVAYRKILRRRPLTSLEVLRRDEDGDVDEDDHRGDDSPPDGTPVPPRERRRGSPPYASSSMASPLDGERFSLWSLAFMIMM